MQLNLTFLTTMLEDINVGEWKCLMLTRHAELLEGRNHTTELFINRNVAP
jgi:hypothetical protein